MRSNKIMQFGFFPTLLCLVAMLLAACGGNGVPGLTGNQPKASADKQIYRYGDIITDIASFDPAQATDQPSIEAIQMAFTGLVQLDDQLQVQPQLAKSYDISKDGLTYTFHLKPNLKFSDGTALTATDVAYSIDRALTPDVSNLNGVTLTYLGQIKGAAERVAGKVNTIIGTGVKVVDPNTVQIVTTQKTAYFLEALTYPTAFVVEKSVIDKWGLTKWTDHLGDNGGQGGAGPFIVQSYDHNSGIKFIPNPNYYGNAPQLQKVEFNFYKTSETAFKAYQANQVDFVKNPPAELSSVTKTLQNHQYGQSNQLTIDYIAMNYLYKPFDNIHIRQAFALAVNKDIIASAIYKGTYTASCHIVPQGMPGYDANLTCPGGAGTSGDSAKAKALFQQGLTEEGLTLATFPKITISYRSNKVAIENAITTMRQEWQQVLGVSVGTQVMDFNQLLKAEVATTCQTPNDLAKCQDKGLQMWAAAWGADYPDPQDWLTLQFDKGAANNQWNYGQNLSTAATAQQAMQAQMEKADTTQDQTARMALYNQAEQSLINDVAWLPINQRSGTHVLKSYVVGQIFNAIDQVPPDDWANIYIANH